MQEKFKTIQVKQKPKLAKRKSQETPTTQMKAKNKLMLCVHYGL